MQKIIATPNFIKCFKDHPSALKALSFLVTAKKDGYTNKEVLEMDLFKALFNEEYLNSTPPKQLEWRLKNIARDLKKMDYENLNVEFHEFKNYFEGTRRKESK